MCFDCEPDYTFGRPAAINDLGWRLFIFWLLARVLRLKLGWLASLAVVVADFPKFTKIGVLRTSMRSACTHSSPKHIRPLRVLGSMIKTVSTPIAR
jgi:hypothetical protein